MIITNTGRKRVMLKRITSRNNHRHLLPGQSLSGIPFDKLIDRNLQRMLDKGDLKLALIESQDAIEVLESGGLHPKAVQLLITSQDFMVKRRHLFFFYDRGLIERAVEFQKKARAELVNLPWAAQEKSDG